MRDADQGAKRLHDLSDTWGPSGGSVSQREPDVTNERDAVAAVRASAIAAQAGKNQLQVLTFPSSFCNDGGRRINSFDPDWPNSLEGFGKKAYEFYEKELRPLGFKIGAEIINFPGGMPGDVGMFLKW